MKQRYSSTEPETDEGNLLDICSEKGMRVHQWIWREVGRFLLERTLMTRTKYRIGYGHSRAALKLTGNNRTRQDTNTTGDDTLPPLPVGA